ncbi:hypothetical protein KKG51_00920, partial [Patescibacteria group bacterium]|nr:hypothetical protein [Patescibacteria group bacterium]
MLTAGVLGVFAAAAIIYVVAFYGQGSEFKGSFFGTPGGMPGATAGLKGTIAGLDIKMLDFSIEENAMLMPVNSTENPVFLAEVNDQFTHGSSACSGAIGGAKCVRMLKKGVNSTLLPPDEGVNCDLNMSQYNEASYYGVCLNENYKENKLDWYLSFLGTCGWGFDLTSCLTGKADSVFEKIKENTTIAADAFCHSSGKSGKFSEIDSDYPDYTFDSVLTSVFFNYMTPEAERPANFTKFVDSIMGGLKESKYCSFHYTKEEMSNFNKYCPNGYYYDSGTTTCAPIM